MAITIIAAFIAGLLSFLSPCVLPLIPAFIGYLSGTSLKNVKSARSKIFFNTVAYVAGFSLVFALLGVLLNSVLGAASYGVQVWLSRIGGIIIIAFGLHLAGIVRLQFLEQEHAFNVRNLNTNYITSFIFGAAFAVGWTPCVGPILGAVLTLAASNPGMSFILLISYSLGLGIPFLLVGLFSEQAFIFIKKLGPHLRYFNLVVGILLIILGILVFTQTLNILANFTFIHDWVLS